MREVDSEEEFFLVITEKGKEEGIRIAVNDIDGMEHCEGSLKFFLHYQRKKDPSKLTGQLKNLIRTSVMGKKPKEKYETVTEVFESKFVARIIECFNGVLTIMQDEEDELNDFVDYEQEPQKVEEKKSGWGFEPKEIGKKAKEMTVVEDYLP